MLFEYKLFELEIVFDTKFIKGLEPKGIPLIDGKPYSAPIGLGYFMYKTGLISKLPENQQNLTLYS
tara:strand:+ start:1516 stop:1713 length:198 start_codon:yes stop_codon:yes gene_type:complete